MNLPMESRWWKWRIFARMTINAINREIYSGHPSNITVMAHTISDLVLPLRTIDGKCYRYCKTTTSNSLHLCSGLPLPYQRLLGCPQKRLCTMADEKPSPQMNWGKESSARLTKFPWKPSQNCSKPSKIKCISAPNAESWRFIISTFSLNILISSLFLVWS